MIITKDLSMIIYGRDARIGPRSLKSLFSGKSGTTNRSSATYELSLKCANKAGSPGKFMLTEFTPEKLFLRSKQAFSDVNDECSTPALPTCAAKKT